MNDDSGLIDTIDPFPLRADVVRRIDPAYLPAIGVGNKDVTA